MLNLFLFLFFWLIYSFLTYLFYSVFPKSTNWKINIIKEVFVTLIIMFILVFLIFSFQLELFENNIVYCSDGNEDNHNPYKLRLVSDYFKKSFELDLKNLYDFALLTGVFKTTVASVKYAPASVKASVGTAVTISTGLIALEFKNSTYGIDQSREIVITSGENSVSVIKKQTQDKWNNNNSLKDNEPSSLSDDIFSIDSPNKEFTVFDTIYSLLISSLGLTLISLFCFIFFVLFYYIKNQKSKLLNKIDNKYLNYIINKIENLSTIIFIMLILLIIVDLSFSLYFINKVIEIIKIIINNN